MSSSDEGGSSSSSTPHQKKYKGVRQRKWGKWVSEIRVPGTQERLWLGSYSTPEAAAVAHDIASYCLRGAPENLNFPLTLPAGVRMGMSPQSIQKAASDAGMAVDAQFAMKHESTDTTTTTVANNQMNSDQRTMLLQDDHFGVNWDCSESKMRQGEEALNISVEDYLCSSEFLFP